MALIDRDALGVGRCNPNSMLDPAYAAGWNGLLNIINSAPIVDAVEVVRCRDCKHWIPSGSSDWGACQKLCNRYTEDCESSMDDETRSCDFCSYGVRKEHD